MPPEGSAWMILSDCAADPGLGELIGHEVHAPEAARKFLYAFHEEEKIEQAKQQRLPDQIAYIPSESEALEGLGKVNQDLVQRFGERCADQKIATVDQDATIIESQKREALYTYEGSRGYQPMLAVWAEMDAILADEFRDGNVPAQMAPLTVAKAAFAALPKTVTNYYYRGDSACHEKGLLRWLLDEKRADGPPGFIGFAISVRMSEALRSAIREVPDQKWKAYGKPETDVDRECAEVVFVSGEESEPKGAKPLRYIAIRLRQRQGGLFSDGSSVLHFAVLSNIWDWEPVKVIEWHREKAGTIEGIHDVLKNELAAGVLPCSRFGANAAWLRLAVLTHNLITALKRMALPEDLLTARPKRLRFLIFHTPGRLVHHARQLSLRLGTAIAELAMCLDAVRLLPLPS